MNWCVGRQLGIRMNHKDVARRLQEWFTLVSALPVWVRVKSPVWVVMRDNLRVLGNWRNAPRGDPAKGFKVMKERANE